VGGLLGERHDRVEVLQHLKRGHHVKTAGIGPAKWLQRDELGSQSAGAGLGNRRWIGVDTLRHEPMALRVLQKSSGTAGHIEQVAAGWGAGNRAPKVPGFSVVISRICSCELAVKLTTTGDGRAEIFESAATAAQQCCCGCWGEFIDQLWGEARSVLLFESMPDRLKSQLMDERPIRLATQGAE